MERYGGGLFLWVYKINVMYCLYYCMFLILVWGLFLWVYKVCFGYWYFVSYIRYIYNNKKNMKIECNIKIKEIYLGVKNIIIEFFVLEIIIWDIWIFVIECI